MRCGCPHCGSYMIQEERGLDSDCLCPDCLHTCNSCMGAGPAPLTRGELIERLQNFSSHDDENRPDELH